MVVCRPGPTRPKMALGNLQVHVVHGDQPAAVDLGEVLRIAASRLLRPVWFPESIDRPPILGRWTKFLQDIQKRSVF